MAPTTSGKGKTAKAVLCPVIEDPVFVAQNVDVEQLENVRFVRCFRPQKTIKYHALCDDFGPMNMGSIIRFIELLDAELLDFPTRKVVYCVEDGRRAMTNAVFLLGAYMIFRCQATLKELALCFQWVDESLAEPFRDATNVPSDFDLTLMDCWMGLQKGISKHWVSTPAYPTSNQWGRINVEEYEHYDHPQNGYLHEVIPGRLVAFTGPVDLGPREYRDDESGYRDLSPGYYVRIFKELGVRTVVRLNEPQYDSSAFTDHGIRHFDLYFDDCTAPPPRVVEAFLKIVDDALRGGGLVAVHCKAGLGRTGTLIALHMMRSHGFRAREAIGWLRIMRPGSVIGDQQHFLAAAAAGGDVPAVSAAGLPAAAAAAAAAATRCGSSTSSSSSAAAAQRASLDEGGNKGEAAREAPKERCAAELAAQVAAGMRRRAVAKAALA